jgi:hypothetical protein
MKADLTQTDRHDVANRHFSWLLRMLLKSGVKIIPVHDLMGY